MTQYLYALKFRQSAIRKFDDSLTRLVQSRLGEGTRLVTGQHQYVYAVNQDEEYFKLPTWVQMMPASQRNEIW